MCESMDKNRIIRRQRRTSEHLPRSHLHQIAKRRSAGLWKQKTAELTPEIAPCPLQRLRLSKGGLTAGQKSAEGILGHDVGKASEALREPKADNG